MKLEDIVKPEELESILEEEEKHYKNSMEEGWSFINFIRDEVNTDYLVIISKHADLKHAAGMFRMLSYIALILKRKA